MKGRPTSEAEVVSELVALHRQGVMITNRGLREAGHPALAAAVSYYGGFVRLRRMAQLAPPRRRPGPPLLDADAVLHEIKRRHKAGETLACTRVPSTLRRSGERGFGSWKAAIQAAGFDYRTIRLLPTYSEAELGELVRQLAREFPDMTVRELARHRLSTTLRDRFGSFEWAARAAGLAGWPRRPARRRAPARSAR